MIQTWIRLFTGPNNSNFEEVSMNSEASMGTAILWRTVSIIIAAALGYVGSLMGLGNVQAQFEQMIASRGDIPPEMQQALSQVATLMTPANLGIMTVLGIVFSLIGFILLCLLYHVIAKMFGGQGSLGTFSYLSAGVWAPVSIITAVLGLIPLIGSCLGVLVGLYGLVLSFFAIKTNYRLGDGRAIVVLILPVLLLIALVFCGVVGVGIVAAGMQSQ